MWMPHLPGQHYDVRLTAPDGYRAQRSYSVASSPLDEGEIELTIDRLDDGEVSPYFHDVVVEGDQVEVRGPFASYFVWRGESPALLVGGGSGVVPLMAMLRHRRRTMPELADAAGLLGPNRPRRHLRGRARQRRGRSPTRASRRPAGTGIRAASTRDDRPVPSPTVASPSFADRTGSSNRLRSCCWQRGSSHGKSAPSASDRLAECEPRRLKRGHVAACGKDHEQSQRKVDPACRSCRSASDDTYIAAAFCCGLLQSDGKIVVLGHRGGALITDFALYRRLIVRERRGNREPDHGEQTCGSSCLVPCLGDHRVDQHHQQRASGEAIYNTLDLARN